jgi:hypothetical protein
MGYRWVCQIWYSQYYFILFFSYVCLKYKVALVQLINCQLFDILLSLKLKSCMLETSSHYTPELLICAPGDLTMSNLTYKANLLQCKCPTLLDQYRNLFYLFVFCLGSKFSCVRQMSFTHVTVWVLHVAPAYQVLAKQTIVSFVICSRGF